MKHTVYPYSVWSLFSLRLLLIGICVNFCGFEATAQTSCPGYTYTVGCNLAPNKDQNLRPDETLYIPVGVTYTGKVNLNGGNNSNAIIYNYGTWEPNDNLILPGTATFYNYRGARATFRDVNLNGATSKFYNLGTLNISQSLSAGGFITNAPSGVINAAASRGITVNSGGQLDNLGQINTSDYMNNNLTNNCGTIRVLGKNGGFTNNSGTVINYGTINTDGDFTNNSDFQGSRTGGAGLVIVAAGSTSAQNGSGRFGVSPSGEQSRLDLCDGDHPARGWDRQNGTVGSFVTYCSTTTPAGCSNSPLPVELLYFKATLTNGKAVLSWATASEKDNHQFVVERSADGESFAPLTEVAGQGTSTSTHTYSVTDAAPLLGTSYYRLRQVDLDGTETYSPVASIQNATTASGSKLGIHPNPATDYITLDLPKAAGESYEVRISTLSGQLVRRVTLKGSEPQLNVQTLPAGTYLIQVQSVSTQLIQRLIKH